MESLEKEVAGIRIKLEGFNQIKAWVQEIQDVLTSKAVGSSENVDENPAPQQVLGDVEVQNIVEDVRNRAKHGVLEEL